MDTLPTEQPNGAIPDLRALSTLEILRVMNAQDALVHAAVGSQLEAIAAAVDAAVERLRAGGRLVLVGAGTSGRLAAMQAAEMGPTFGFADGIVVACTPSLARHDHDGAAADDATLDDVVAEDDEPLGEAHVRALDVSAGDMVVGVTASGSTPYVLGAIEESRRRGAFCVGVASNHPTALSGHVDVAIHPIVGPEVIAGSTRLKAGTAQKLVLDMLTTGAMIRLGHVYRNRMVGVRASNAKLRDRARRIVADVSGMPPAAVDGALQSADWSVPVALVMLARGLTAGEARHRLASSVDLGAAIGETHAKEEGR